MARQGLTDMFHKEVKLPLNSQSDQHYFMLEMFRGQGYNRKMLATPPKILSEERGVNVFELFQSP
jgi:hypothetical protein